VPCPRIRSCSPSQPRRPSERRFRLVKSSGVAWGGLWGPAQGWPLDRGARRRSASLQRRRPARSPRPGSPPASDKLPERDAPSREGREDHRLGPGVLERVGILSSPASGGVLLRPVEPSAVKGSPVRIGQTLWFVVLSPQGVGLRPQAWAGLSRPVGPVLIGALSPPLTPQAFAGSALALAAFSSSPVLRPSDPDVRIPQAARAVQEVGANHGHPSAIVLKPRKADLSLESVKPGYNRANRSISLFIGLRQTHSGKDIVIRRITEFFGKLHGLTGFYRRIREQSMFFGKVRCFNGKQDDCRQ
jgi:hypothetical protein